MQMPARRSCRSDDVEIRHHERQVTLEHCDETAADVAILAAMVQMGTLMNIHPGPAAISFAAVVILTMFSAMSFDPRLIWDRAHHAQSGKDSTTSDRSS